MFVYDPEVAMKPALALIALLVTVTVTQSPDIGTTADRIFAQWT